MHLGQETVNFNRGQYGAICQRGSYQDSGYDGGIFLCNADGSNRVRVTRSVFKHPYSSPQTDVDDREV